MFQQNIQNRGSPQTSRRWLSLPAAILLILSAAPAHAATYYVATNGNDSNSGSQSAPFKTFDRAIAPLQPGDTLYIRGGTYTDRIDLMSPSKTGTPNAWITIAGYPGEKAIIQYLDPNRDRVDTEQAYGAIKMYGNRGYFIFENFTLDGINTKRNSTWSIAYGNHDIIVRNLEIKNYWGSGLRVAGDNIQVINSEIHDQTKPGRFYCIYISHGDNILIEGNNCYNNNGGGLNVYYGSLRNVIIRNNLIHHNSSVDTTLGGILVWGVRNGAKGSSDGIDGVQIYNNVIYKNCASGGSCEGIEVSHYTRNVKIWNNTIYGNGGVGINIPGGERATNTVVQNNIIFGHDRAIIDNGINSTIDHNITTDPQFVNAGANDFGVQAGSPAIDKGVSLAAVPTDFTGKARPEGAAYDLGAFEGAGSRKDVIPAVGGGITPISGGAGSSSGGSLGLGNCLK